MTVDLVTVTESGEQLHTTAFMYENENALQGLEDFKNWDCQENVQKNLKDHFRHLK